MNNLETYLRKNCEQNVIDHALRAEVAADGTVSFYLHPNGVDGETLDYRVATNTLTPKFGVAEPNAGERFDCKRWLDALEKWVDAKLHRHWLRHHTGFEHAHDTTEVDKARQELVDAIRSASTVRMSEGGRET